MTAFPTGAHDDQVDAAASGFAMFVDPTTGLYDFTKDEAERIRQADAELNRLMGLPPAAQPIR